MYKQRLVQSAKYQSSNRDEKSRFFSKIDLPRGTKGWGEQRRGLRTKALMRDLGTRLACQHKSFCKRHHLTVEKL